MSVYNEYREWADVLNDWKCGGHRPHEDVEPEMGAYYRVFWCERFESVLLCDEEHYHFFFREMNDPENDVWRFEKCESEHEAKEFAAKHERAKRMCHLVGLDEAGTDDLLGRLIADHVELTPENVAKAIGDYLDR